jgi:cytochrome c6
LDAKKLYKLYCTSCHGLKGNLKINGAKDLTKSEIDLENAVAQVYYGKGLMTSFKPLLSEEEIVAVSKYTETLRK